MRDGLAGADRLERRWGRDRQQAENPLEDEARDNEAEEQIEQEALGDPRELHERLSFSTECGKVGDARSGRSHAARVRPALGKTPYSVQGASLAEHLLELDALDRLHEMDIEPGFA